MRFHKQAHFNLCQYTRGDVADHDNEVNEACWVEIDAAIQQLAFAKEQQIVARARDLIAAVER
ncbi:MAG: hypothetical protein IT318_12635 [Anaerolineales bacterium]|nr:hypothetical protein [Anaerolineales bacterium]